VDVDSDNLIYTGATERSPLDGGDGSARGITLSVYYNPRPTDLAVVRQPTALVTSEGYRVVINPNISERERLQD
jgi:hypothetical protein